MSSLHRIAILSALITIIMISFARAGAQGPARVQDNDSPLVQDAKEYATRFGVDLDEAVHRLKIQHLAGELDAVLTKKESDKFAGLWIQHNPEFRFVVLLTSGTKETIRTYLNKDSLKDLVEVKSAKTPLKKLRANQRLVLRYAKTVDIRADSAINVIENLVELRVVQPELFNAALQNARLQLPASVRVVKVDQLLSPSANIYAGLAIIECTTGFSVRHSTSGEMGVLTAGHCRNTQSYNGTNIPHRGEFLQGARDVQWHAAPGFTVRNWAQDGICCDSTPYYRVITGTRSRNNQAIGEFVCKYGQTTGRTCGNIVHKNAAPWWVLNATATFIGVDGPVGSIIGGDGDSGGPWYAGNIAYGIYSGGNGANYAVYMAINYASQLGVSVLVQ